MWRQSANAVLPAMEHDGYEAACALVVIAKVMVGDDPANRAALARWMVRKARELDPDALCPPWWRL
jgi:hypothetical protein